MRLRRAGIVVAGWALACGLTGPAVAPAPCGDDDAAACAAAAKAMVTVDPLHAALRFEDACRRLDHAPSCGEAAGLLRAGAITASLPDPTGAASPFGRAVSALGHGCDLGQPADCSTLGMMAFQGLGVPKNLDVARERFDAACAAGLADACADAGLVREQQGTDVPRAVADFERACAQGSGRGCTKLGLLLGTGGAVPRDPEAGVVAMERACALGYAPGCGLAALQLLGGQGVTADPVRRRAALEAGARLGDPVAVDLLIALRDDPSTDDRAGIDAVLGSVGEAAAIVCAKGGQGEACHVRGLVLQATGAQPSGVAGAYETACALKERVACGRLAAMVHAGTVEDRFGKLVDLDALGCTGGFGPACLALGRAMESGEQTEGADPDGARDAYRRGCSAGLEAACVEAKRMGVRFQMRPTP